MSEQMEFPETFEKFAEDYGFKDTKEVYTNGSDLIPVYRVKQWLEHDNKLRVIEQEPILDKIRAEIEQLTILEGGEDYIRKMAELYSLKIKVLQIIDKYTG